MSAAKKPHPSDSALVIRALDGDLAAFGQLVERHFGPVFAVALARLRDPEAAEDLAQEVFLRAQLHLQQLGPGGNFPAWAVRIARNLAIDWQRRRQCASRLLPQVQLRETTGDVPDTTARGAREAMVMSEERGAVRSAIMDLPEDLREIVLLHWTEDLTQQEIADRLGIHQATVSRQIKRALAALRGTLEPVLRDAAPTLRPPRRAVVKSLGIVMAVGAMSATAKATLAASTAVGQWTSVAETAQAGAVGAVGVIGFLQSLPAFIAGGVKVMTTGKGIAAAAVAVAAVAGGTYQVMRVSESPPPVITGLTAMPIVAIPAGNFEMGLSDSEMQTLATLQFAQEGDPDRDLAEQWIARGLPFEEMAREIGATPSPNQTLLDLTAFVTNRSGRPVHRVALDAFGMSVTEVTAAQYLEFVQATGHRPPEENRHRSHLTNPNMPITGVSWDDAMAFCAWLTETQPGTYSLPTEAEWEYACRARTTTLFSFGDTLRPDQAHFSHDIHGAGPLDVGSFPANAWGLHDMHGNVAEWCLDAYADDFYRSPEATERNPVNQTVTNQGRAVRGGGWVGVVSYPNGELCRSSGRLAMNQDFRAVDLGFRVVWFDAEPDEIRGAEIIELASHWVEPDEAALLCQENLRQIAMAISLWTLDHPGLSTEATVSLDQLVQAGHLDEVPICPEGGIYGSVSAGPGVFRWTEDPVCSIGGNHARHPEAQLATPVSWGSPPSNLQVPEGGSALGQLPDLQRVTLRSEEVHEGISWRFFSFTEGVLTLPVEPEQVDLVLYFDGNDCSQGALLGNDDRPGYVFPIGHRSWGEVVDLSPPASDEESAIGIMPLTRDQEGMALWVRANNGELYLVRIAAVHPATYSDLVSGETAEVELEWWQPQS